MPERLRLSRQRGYRKPEGAVVVSRPSRWGNPFTLEWARMHRPDMSDAKAREFATRSFRSWLLDEGFSIGLSALDGRRAWILDHLYELRGKSLCCWCPLPAGGQEDHCHAFVLLCLANQAKGNH